MASSEKDNRLYIKVHHGMPEHPKVEGLSDAAFRLLVTTWCWCDRLNTDGAVLAASWRKRGTARARKELLDAGLAEITPQGVQMHDYLEHQRSAAEKAALSEERRKAGAKGGRARATAQANAKQELEQMPKQTRSKVQADVDVKEDVELQVPQHQQKGGGGSVPRGIVPPPPPSTSTTQPCRRHPNGTADACADCRNWRLAVEAEQADTATETAGALLAAQLAIDNCSRCDASGWINIERPGMQDAAVRCTHLPETRTA